MHREEDDFSRRRLGAVRCCPDSREPRLQFRQRLCVRVANSDAGRQLARPRPAFQKNAGDPPAADESNASIAHKYLFHASRFTHHSSITISGSTTISDFTEFATNLYFCAAWSARRVRASIVARDSPAAAMRITGRKSSRVKISVRSSSMSLVPSLRHSYESSLSLKRSVAQTNIIITQVFAAATKASSGVNTPACPCASGGAENFISGPFPITRCPQCSPSQRTVVL